MTSQVAKPRKSLAARLTDVRPPTRSGQSCCSSRVPGSINTTFACTRCVGRCLLRVGVLDMRLPFSRFLLRSSVLRSYHVIRKEAGLFCRTSSSVRLWWELEEPKGPKGPKGCGVGAPDLRLQRQFQLMQCDMWCGAMATGDECGPGLAEVHCVGGGSSFCWKTEPPPPWEIGARTGKQIGARTGKQ